MLEELSSRFDCMIFVGEVHKIEGKKEQVPYTRKASGPKSWIRGSWSRMWDWVKKGTQDG